MQMQTFFVSDPKKLDWERCTSFKVIEDIYTSNRGFFDRIADMLEASFPSDRNNATMSLEELEDIRLGMRAAKISRTGDAKITPDEIAAWDRLVTERLLPSVGEEIEALATEAERLGMKESPVYAHAVGLQRDRARWIAEQHERFRSCFEIRLAICLCLSSCDSP